MFVNLNSKNNYSKNIEIIMHWNPSLEFMFLKFQLVFITIRPSIKISNLLDHQKILPYLLLLSLKKSFPF